MRVIRYVCDADAPLECPPTLYPLVLDNSIPRCIYIGKSKIIVRQAVRCAEIWRATWGKCHPGQGNLYSAAITVASSVTLFQTRRTTLPRDAPCRHAQARAPNQKSCASIHYSL